MTTAPNVIIAYAAEDGRFDHVVRAAADSARESAASLVLYDIDASGLADPLPNELWSGENDTFADRLDQSQLKLAGRDKLAARVSELRESGIEAYGWLPSKGGSDVLAEYAASVDADLIVVPSDLADPSFIDRIRNRSLESLEDHSSRPIALVAEDGTVEMHPETPYP